MTPRRRATESRPSLCFENLWDLTGFVYNWVARYNALVWLDGSETKKRELALEYKELIFLQSFGRCYLTWQPMLGGLSGYLLDRIKNSDRL